MATLDRKSIACVAALLGVLALGGCDGGQPRPGMVDDEAKRAGLTPAHFKAADEDYFRGMDSGIALSPEEIKGRNTWIVWTGGNDRLWDKLSHASVGNLDFLKTLSSNNYARDRRWRYLGLVNEPCFEAATGPIAPRIRSRTPTSIRG